MTNEEVFDEIESAIETVLLDTDLNPYGAEIMSFIPSYEPDIFPVIVISQVDYRLVGKTLNKHEKKYKLSIECQIFSKDVLSDSVVIDHKRDIANTIDELIKGVLLDTYGLGLAMRNVIPNLDENIYRIVVRYEGVIDENTKVIYIDE